MSSLPFLSHSRQHITCADILSRRFTSCSVFEKECYLRYHSFSCSFSLSLYVLDADVFSSPFIRAHFLVLGGSPLFLFPITYSGVSLSLCRQGSVHFSERELTVSLYRTWDKLRFVENHESYLSHHVASISAVKT